MFPFFKNRPLTNYRNKTILFVGSHDSYFQALVLKVARAPGTATLFLFPAVNWSVICLPSLAAKQEGTSARVIAQQLTFPASSAWPLDPWQDARHLCHRHPIMCPPREHLIWEVLIAGQFGGSPHPRAIFWSRRGPQPQRKSFLFTDFWGFEKPVAVYGPGPFTFTKRGQTGWDQDGNCIS